VIGMYAVVRIRGEVNIRRELRETLELLRLHKVNHMVLVEEKPEKKKMIEKIQAFVTFGEIEAETLGKVLQKRGRLVGNKKLDEEFLKKNKVGSFKELAQGILDGKIKMKEIGIKPVFRMNPPKKGYERAGIKKSFSIGGAAGYRASEINDLILKMVR